MKQGQQRRTSGANRKRELTTSGQEALTAHLMVQAISQPVLDQRPREASERKSANVGPRDCSRKGHVVVVLLEIGADITKRNAIFKDVVNSLDVEGLLDFGVRGNVQMK